MDELYDLYNAAVRDFHAICEQIAQAAVWGDLPTAEQMREYDAAKTLMQATWGVIETNTRELRELNLKGA